MLVRGVKARRRRADHSGVTVRLVGFVLLLALLGLSGYAVLHATPGA
jgi:hypothetical protein